MSDWEVSIRRINPWPPLMLSWSQSIPEHLHGPMNWGQVVPFRLTIKAWAQFSQEKGQVASVRKTAGFKNARAPSVMERFGGWEWMPCSLKLWESSDCAPRPEGWSCLGNHWFYFANPLTPNSTLAFQLTWSCSDELITFVRTFVDCSLWLKVHVLIAVFSLTCSSSCLLIHLYM